MTASAYVYALGRIGPRFPSPAVEKEFAQATGRAETAGLTDRQAVHQVLSERQNRYLTRQLCWVLTIEGLETYILQARDPVDLDLLVEAIRPAPSPMDVDAVIGVVKAFIFGGIIALVGCYKGLTCGLGAEGVGRATTEAVIYACITILITDFFLTMLISIVLRQL